MQRLFLIVIFLIGLMDAASAQLYRGQTWKSDNGGSILKIASVDNRGNFQGTFINYAADTPCIGIPYPVSGFTGGPQVNFTVNFTKCRATKKWLGNAMGGAMTVGWGMNYIDPNGKPATAHGFDAFFVQQQGR
jgi:hypothetical protein